MKTESNIRPSAQLEIEALPKVAGKPCTVIFYQNIEGPVQKPEGDAVFTYDRYTLETTYRENLEEAIMWNYEAWLNKAIAAEQAGEEKTDMEILQEQVESLKMENEALKASNEELKASNEELKASNEELNAVVDELIIASLGGDDLV